MRLNGVKDRCAAGQPVLGTFSYSPDPALVEIAAAAGMNFVIVDTEHAQLGDADVAALVRTARGVGLTAYVRVGNPSAHTIGRALDAGAAGIVLPHVNNELLSGELASAARYPPAGSRSACTCSPATAYSLTDFASYVVGANEDTWVIGQIEDRSALNRIEEIVTSGRLDVVMPGVSDLATSLGVPGELDHPLVAEAVDRIVAAVEESASVELAMYVSDPSQLARWAARGVKIFVYSIDYKLVARAYKSMMSELLCELERKVA